MDRQLRMPPIVRLWDFVGLGLVLEYPTGIRYSNQTGGTSCLQPSLEGVLVPLGNDTALPEGTILGPSIELFEYFSGSRHDGAGATRGLDAADAAYIDGVLRRYRLGDWICVDRERIDQSHEAWVHVNVEREPAGDEAQRIFSGLGPYPRRGVLTWQNTD